MRTFKNTAPEISELFERVAIFSPSGYLYYEIQQDGTAQLDTPVTSALPDASRRDAGISLPAGEVPVGTLATDVEPMRPSDESDLTRISVEPSKHILRYTRNDTVSKLQMTAKTKSELFKASVEQVAGKQAVGVTLGIIKPSSPHQRLESRVLYMPEDTPPKMFGNHVSQLYLDDPDAYKQYQDWVTSEAIRIVSIALAATLTQNLMQSER